jgi:hypothetical protein
MNPLIPEEFFEYLEANGFRRSHSADGKATYLTNGETGIMFRYEKATFYTWFDGSDDEWPDIKEFGSVDGLSQLGIFGFMLVLHAYNIVSMKGVIREARKEEPDLFRRMAEIIAPAHLPECY